MDASTEKKPSENSCSNFRTKNALPINWKDFWEDQTKFIYSALFTIVGLAIGAGILLWINKRTEGSISAVACQALLGIASEPLMLLSALLLVGAALFVTALLIWIPQSCLRTRDYLKRSFEGIGDFSTQLPLAVGGVGIATSWHLTAILSMLILFFFCLVLAVIQHLMFSIVLYSVDHEQTTCGKVAASVAILLILVAVACASTFVEWHQFLNAPRICS